MLFADKAFVNCKQNVKVKKFSFAKKPTNISRCSFYTLIIHEELIVAPPSFRLLFPDDIIFEML